MLLKTFSTSFPAVLVLLWLTRNAIIPFGHASTPRQILGISFGIANVIALLYKLVVWPNFLSPLRHIPAPEGANFILGHLGKQFGDDKGGYYDRITREVPNDGFIRLKGPFQSDQLLLTAPKAFTEMLVTKSYDFPKPKASAELLASLIGNGLVVAEGSVHKTQRKHSSPSFAFRQIRNLYPLFWEKATGMTNAIDQDAFERRRKRETGLPTGIVDIGYWAPKATLDIIGVAGLGRDFDTLGGSADELAHWYEELTTPSPKDSRFTIFFVFLGRWMANLLMPTYARDLHRTTETLRKYSTSFVREKRVQLSQGLDQPADTLTSLMRSGAFSDEELVDQLLTIIAAGHETTSSAFTWTIYALATRPDLQSRLRDELQQIQSKDFAKDPERIVETMEHLPLLNGVCNETLRLFPTVPVIRRACTHDNTLLGVPIPARTGILISPWAVNKDPQLWGPDATEFKVERWIDADTGKINNTGGASTNFAVMTFIHGPRSCIGQGFAKAELRCLVAAFVGMFAFELEDPNRPVIPTGGVTTKPKDGLRVKLTKVKKWEE